MSRRVAIGRNVYEAAIERLAAIYAQGHRMVVSFSAGKDSGAVLEMAIVAARLANALPVDVVMRDEEALYPGTFEYAERVANRPEVRFNWQVGRHAIINVFNRREPYWWAFDPLLRPDQWMRQPPAFADWTGHPNIERMTTPDRFPAAPGKDTMAVLGLRVCESRGRLFGIFSSGGYLTKPNAVNVRSVRPIYDWGDADIWRAYHEFGWDINPCYATLYRMGVKKAVLRVGPPTLTVAGAGALEVAARAWPAWFDALSTRCPGVRQAALFGKKAVLPRRNPGETWEQTFHRECIETAPDWIATRAEGFLKTLLHAHRRHSTAPLPEITRCHPCRRGIGSWRNLTNALYGGDPFGLKTNLPWIDPEFFRPGAGTW